MGLDVDTNTFAVTWLRRYKWDSELVNGRSNYADEDLAGYKVFVLDPSDDSIKRQSFVTAPPFVYTQSEQVIDFGSPQTSLELSVIPMCKTIGSGHPTIITYGI